MRRDPAFSVRALTPPGGLSSDRMRRRIDFLNRLDPGDSGARLGSQEVEGMDRFYQRAIDMLSSERLRRVFDLQQESGRIRDSYGRTNLGQACLLARRLVEAGVRFVGIDFGGWDTHLNNFRDMKKALAALLQDLHNRGMLDRTIVWSTGEFGRTPQINANAGRDHWGRAFSMMLAGGGIQGGRVVGRTDARAAEPTEGACTPDDVAASFLQAMGIDHLKEYHTPDGRPVFIVRNGRPIRAFFA